MTLQLIPPLNAQKSASLFLIRLDALAALKLWKEVTQELNVQPSPLVPYLVELFRARSLGELKKRRESEAAWEKTFHLIQYQPQALQYVGEYAVQLEAWPQAKRVFEQMSRFPHYAVQSHVQLLQIAEKEENFPEIAARLQRILELEPGKKEALNDLAYVDLLLNRNVEKSFQIAQDLVKQEPNTLSFRSTLALAYLRKGEERKALAVYQGLTIDWKTAAPMARWIFYVTLKSNHEENFAQRFEDQIKGISIRKLEQALLPQGKSKEKS